jgi:hypothetical protein
VKDFTVESFKIAAVAQDPSSVGRRVGGKRTVICMVTRRCPASGSGSPIGSTWYSAKGGEEPAQDRRAGSDGRVAGSRVGDGKARLRMASTMRTIPENGMAALRLSPVAIRGDRDRKGYGLLRAIHAAADGVGCLRRTKRLWGVCCASADTRVPPITAAMVAIGRCWGFPKPQRQRSWSLLAPGPRLRWQETRWKGEGRCWWTRRAQ